jgi:ADP-ribosylglycohydrolase
VLSTKNERLIRACLSLEGLSVGDAFGEKFFVHPDVVESLIAARAIPAASWWSYTDDTQMALSIVSVLRECGTINQELLAQSFATRYDNGRGYGQAMQRLLMQIKDGEPWQKLASSLFDGQGSYGNGAAMRVAPLGAFFAEDMSVVVSSARASAEVTHTHREAVAGAVAVAVAAAWAWRVKDSLPRPQDFLRAILPFIPDSEVRAKLILARDLEETASVQSAVAVLGNGTLVSAQDTVPFALWCAAQHLDNYAEALWLTVSGLGDRDTNCAIVGGIVVLSAGGESIPTKWLQTREPLPNW